MQAGALQPQTAKAQTSTSRLQTPSGSEQRGAERPPKLCREGSASAAPASGCRASDLSVGARSLAARRSSSPRAEAAMLGERAVPKLVAARRGSLPSGHAAS